MATKKNRQDARKLIKVHCAIIEECLRIISNSEDELIKLQLLDRWKGGVSNVSFLWKNLQAAQNVPEPGSGIPDRSGEDPCFVIEDLLLKQLPRLQSGLRMQGCSILVQDKTGRFCITGSVDESTFERIRESGQHRIHRSSM